VQGLHANQYRQGAVGKFNAYRRASESEYFHTPTDANAGPRVSARRAARCGGGASHTAVSLSPPLQPKLQRQSTGGGLREVRAGMVSRARKRIT